VAKLQHWQRRERQLIMALGRNLLFGAPPQYAIRLGDKGRFEVPPALVGERELSDASKQ